jgi:receptor protein-tyrosine kinase
LSAADAFQASQFSQQRVASYAELVRGPELAGRVVDRLGLGLTSAQLSKEISASSGSGTVLIDVTVTDASPQRAQQIADVLGQEFPALVTRLEMPADGGASPVKVTVTEAPNLPTARSSPRTGLNIALGLLIGVVLGVGAAIARARLDRTVTDGDEAADLVGAPVIGIVMRDEALRKRHVMDLKSANQTAEAFRRLRTNLQFLNVDHPPKVIMVSSAVPAEGKSTVVVNLALALVEAGRTVTIVEADLRRPTVARYLGVVGDVGLTNVLSGTAEVDDVVQRYGEGNLSVIGPGPLPPNPGSLLASTHMAELLDKMRAENDFVLLDAAPLLPVADSSGLAVHTDGVLVAVRYGNTRKDQLQQVAASLERVGATTLGVILNIVPPKAELAVAYGHGYGYGYETGSRAHT